MSSQLEAFMQRVESDLAHIKKMLAETLDMASSVKQDNVQLNSDLATARADIVKLQEWRKKSERKKGTGT